jgi:hypothetical protein
MFIYDANNLFLLFLFVVNPSIGIISQLVDQNVHKTSPLWVL